jgi:hypothetical protein
MAVKFISRKIAASINRLTFAVYFKRLPARERVNISTSPHPLRLFHLPVGRHEQFHHVRHHKVDRHRKVVFLSQETRGVHVLGPLNKVDRIFRYMKVSQFQ